MCLDDDEISPVNRRPESNLNVVEYSAKGFQKYILERRARRSRGYVKKPKSKSFRSYYVYAVVVVVLLIENISR